MAGKTNRGSKPGERRGGREKGTPNKITADARKAIAEFVEGNAGRLTGWLDRVADDDPAKAFDLFMRVVEYHIPKLARTEVTAEMNGEVTIKTIERKILPAPRQIVDEQSVDSDA